MSDADDDAPHLSSDTFAALQEFYKEQELREAKLNSIKTNSGGNENVFEENWQLSQFWYDDETADALVETTIRSVPKQSKVALISCPTLFKRFRDRFVDGEVKLFEYDERFAIFGNDFVLYDYKSPLSIPRELADSFDVVVADPPFLSEECLTKTAVTIRFLTKNKIILCTGSVMEELAGRLLGVRKMNFVPHHRNNLANEFRCFANFDFDAQLAENN